MGFQFPCYVEDTRSKTLHWLVCLLFGKISVRISKEIRDKVYPMGKSFWNWLLYWSHWSKRQREAKAFIWYSSTNALSLPRFFLTIHLKDIKYHRSCFKNSTTFQLISKLFRGNLINLYHLYPWEKQTLKLHRVYPVLKYFDNVKKIKMNQHVPWLILYSCLDKQNKSFETHDYCKRTIHQTEKNRGNW